MQKRGWWLAVWMLGVVVSPFAALGQFQAPTDEELKMTSEPTAPGAAASYLYREETVDDNLHFHSYYARIKVLTEKGKELATVTVPYPKGAFSITDIKARTIHADGQIFPLDVKPADLVDRKGTGFQMNKMVFTLPNVEVGSILEYRWQMRYDDGSLSSPDWRIQQPFFVRKAHYMFSPYKYMDRVTDSKGDSASKLMVTSMGVPQDKLIYDKAGAKYVLDVTDIPALPEEEYMPPLGAFVVQVRFYYTAYTAKDEFWKHEGERWSKEMNKFAGESKPLKEAVAGIIAPADAEEVKARKLYDAVMALENTDYTRQKSTAEMKQLHLKQIKSAEDVWKDKSGSSNEIALLYLAMVRIAGLKAYAFTVCNRDVELFNPYLLSLNQFDDDLVIVSINGKDVTLDPGKKLAPFGQLAWTHFFVGGLRQSDKGTEFAQTSGNSYKEATTIRSADLTIDKTGQLTGTVRLSMNGPAALRWRQLSLENDPEEVKKRFNEHMKEILPDGVDADFDHFLAIEDYHSPLMGIVKVSGNIGTVTGKRIFIPALFFESHAKHPFVAEDKRIAPVDMGYADSVQDEVVFHFPDGYKVESAPADTSIPWKDHAQMIIKAIIKENEVTVGRALAKNFTLLNAENYKDLHDFYQKVAAADQQQIVLTVAVGAASKGN